MRYEFGGLIFGGAYKWRGLFSEFYGFVIDNAVNHAPAQSPFNNHFTYQSPKCCYSSLALFPLYTLFVRPPSPPNFVLGITVVVKETEGNAFNLRLFVCLFVVFFFLGVRVKYNTCSKPCFTYISCT